MGLEIQQSVNQILGSASAAASLYAFSPMGKKKQEIRDLKKNITEGEARAEAAEKGYYRVYKEHGEPAPIEQAQVKVNEDIRKKVVEDKKRLAELTGGKPEQFEDIAYDEEKIAYDLEEKESKIAETQKKKTEVAKAESDISNIINEAGRAARLEKRESKIAEIQKQQQLAEEQKMAQVATAEKNKAESEFIRDVIMNPGKYPPNAIQEYKANQSMTRKVI